MGHPTVYPTGTTIYNKEKSQSGYTIFQALDTGALLIDMNGKEVHLWKGLHGFPNKILPGGYVLGHSGQRDPKYGMQDMLDLIQVDWDGNVVWKFDHHEFIEDKTYDPRWIARAHHDYQREGSTTGYYAPGQEPNPTGGNTLLLVHKDVIDKKISDQPLLDDAIIEIDWEGNILWEWFCHEHFDEYGFDDEAKKVLRSTPNMRKSGGGRGDWMHINAMSTLGPNRFYDAGDERFHPDNIIWDGRETNIIAIISKETGKLVWKLGPTYRRETTKEIGQIIGQHHAHMIPKGLPGEGNILIFDNGGWAGYGAPNPTSSTGQKNAWRDYSRVLEIDPVTLEIIWQYTPKEALFIEPSDSSRFYSPYISAAQRLLNGNTLITEGSDGRIFEITRDHEIVWEYISPYIRGDRSFNMVYRAYRVPYEWIPQLDKPEEIPIKPPSVAEFRVPGSASKGSDSVVIIPGTMPYQEETDVLCIETAAAQTYTKLYDVDQEIFQTITAENKMLLQEANEALILFGGTHCVNCKMMHKKLSDGVNTIQPISLYYVDTNQNEELTMQYEILGVPALLFLKEGEMIGKLNGVHSLTEVISFIKSSKEGK